MADVKCRAKNPANCWKHGSQQGKVAYEKIQTIVANSDQKYFLTAEERAAQPLKKLTPVGLALTLLDQCKLNPNLNEVRIKNAILMAANLHQEDLRSNRGRYDKTAYIEHPLRNAVRAIRYGCNDETVIIGSLFHDIVEDHPFELSEQYCGIVAKTEQEARDNSYKYLRNAYGERVANMVEGMSNPIVDRYTPAVEKNRIYAEHVQEAIQNPDVCVGKVCDFVDNAVGLVHNMNGTMNPVGIAKRAKKYLPVCDIIETHLVAQKNNNTLPVPLEGIDKMIKHVHDGRLSLSKIIKTLDT